MKKRQNWRSFFIIISFLLFPITQFYFSPYLMVWGASEGVITAAFFTFAVFLTGSLVIGRAFCGWIMPCAGLQEIYFQISNKKPTTGKFGYIKFIIWITWIVSVIVVVLQAGGYKKTDYFFHIQHGISVSNIYMYIPYYAVILLFFINSIAFGKRATCHYICWMSPFMMIGRKISNLLNLPSLRIGVVNENCTECNLCNKECPMSLNVTQMVKDKRMENRECILCGKCADICSKKSIKFYFGRIKK